MSWFRKHSTLEDMQMRDLGSHLVKQDLTFSCHAADLIKPNKPKESSGGASQYPGHSKLRRLQLQPQQQNMHAELYTPQMDEDSPDQTHRTLK